MGKSWNVPTMTKRPKRRKCEPERVLTPEQQADHKRASEVMQAFRMMRRELDGK